MPTTLLKYGLLGEEDLNIGTGMFEAELSNGRRVTLHQINLSSFVAGDSVDKAIYFTNVNDVGQDADLTWDTSAGLLTVVGAARIGTSGTVGGTLHVTQAGVVNLRIENTSLTTGNVGLEWAIAGAVDWNLTAVDGDSDNLVLSSTGTVSSTPHMTFIRDSGVVAIGSRAANTHITQGLLINQSAYDDHALQLHSVGEVAHGITDLAPASAYCYMAKYAATVGGLDLAGLTEGTVALSVHGLIETEDTTTADNSTAAVHVETVRRFSANVGALGPTGNLFIVKNFTTTMFIVKGDGDVANSGGATAMAIYDDYDDVKLLRSVKAAMAPNYKEALGDWVDSHMEVLERTGVITRSESGYFISLRGWRGLLIDTINQLATRIDNLELRIPA